MEECNCDVCNGIYNEDECEVEICDACDEQLEYCDCEHCEECGGNIELWGDCSCERCEDCGELLEYCDC